MKLYDITHPFVSYTDSISYPPFDNPGFDIESLGATPNGESSLNTVEDSPCDFFGSTHYHPDLCIFQNNHAIPPNTVGGLRSQMCLPAWTHEI